MQITAHPSPRNQPQAERISITKKFINNLSQPASNEPRHTHWDSGLKGFGVRVYSTGAVVYILQYRMKKPGAKTQTFTIGKHGSPWTPDTARDRAQDLLEQVRKGTDPAAETRAAAHAGEIDQREAAEAEQRARHYDFDAFADRYIEQHVEANALRSSCDIEGTFRRDLRPWFKGKCVLDITTQQVKDMRAHVGKRSRSAANKAHKWLNAAFMWGIEHDGLTSSPMRDLTRPFPEPKRERVLSDFEVALIWSVLPALAWPFAMLMRLLLLTGQRLREVAGMRWEEIDLAKGEWIIPGTRTKNKRTHLIPISPQVHRILVTIEPDPKRRHGPVLTTDGRTPISGFSKAKQAIDELVAAALLDKRWASGGPLEPWVMHDARRTFSTGCGRLKIPLEHAEAILNHVSGTLGGVAGVYWLYRYLAEKRTALRRWGNHVEKLLSKHKLELLPPAD